MTTAHRAVVDVGTPPRERVREWETIEVRFHGFHAVSPDFSLCNRRWRLTFFPRGYDHTSRPGMMGLYFVHRSTDRYSNYVHYCLAVRDSDGKEVAHFSERRDFAPFDGAQGVGGFVGGTANFANRQNIADTSLDAGAFVVEVRMTTGRSTRNDHTPLQFIPENPSACKMVQDMFMDEASADVVFEVGAHQEDTSARTRKRAKTSPATFYGHQLIVQRGTTTLGELCELGDKNEDVVTVSISDVSPGIFNHLLRYIYGFEIAGDELESDAKAIIEAADKYGISNLKLAAEAALVKSTKLTVDNVMEHLLYADAKNCALLKEFVMDHILKNKAEVLAKVSFQDVPGSTVSDVLAAVARGEGKSGNDGGREEADFSTMRISDLRRRVHEKGLDVDGSRETLIAALESNSSESSSESESED